MKRTAFALAAILALGGSALAAGGTAPPPKAVCDSFENMKAEFAKDKDLAKAKFTAVTAGQFHFLAGYYAASPFTPAGLPPGDGAQLMDVGGKSSIIWTRGKKACISLMSTGQQDANGQPHLAYMPMPVPPDLLKILEAVKTGADEAFPNKDNGDELKL